MILRALAAVLVGLTVFGFCVSLGQLALAAERWDVRQRRAKERRVFDSFHERFGLDPDCDAYTLTDAQAERLVAALRNGFSDEVPGVIPAPSPEGAEKKVATIYVGPYAARSGGTEAFIEHERQRGALS